MLRAPIWITSACSSTASTWRGSISSVTIGSPVSSRASTRISSASSPRPLKVYGDVRGLKAPPRSIVEPRVRDRARGLERLLAVLDRARPGDQAEGVVADPAAAHLDHGRIRARAPARRACTASGSAAPAPRRGSPRAGSAASASRSPIAPITVASRPGVTCASAPASASRSTTWSISSGVACAPMTIRSSGDPVTAMELRILSRS